MPHESDGVSRRGALRAIAGAGGAVLLGGRAAGGSGETIAANVGYADDAGRRALLAAADSVERDYGWNAACVRAPRRRLSALARRDDVRYVEPDRRMRAITDVRSALGAVDAPVSAPSTPLQASPPTRTQTLPWGVDRVDADVAHGRGATGDGIDVAVVDTGVASDHPDLRSNLAPGRAFVPGVGRIPQLDRPAWEDDNGHGTFSAGVVAAADDATGVVGVAPEVRIRPVKVLTALGVGPVSAIAAGIEFVADRGWDVANISLGSPVPTPLVRDACRYAAARGTLLVAAAGNAGPAAPDPPAIPDAPDRPGIPPTDDRPGSSVAYPAAYPEVMAVGATTRGDELAAFSSAGPEVDLVAPGAEIRSTVPTLLGSYAALSGTSFACPHVSGAAALLAATGDRGDAARDRLVDAAEDVGLPAEEAGAGLLDAAAALGFDSSEDLARAGPA